MALFVGGLVLGLGLSVGGGYVVWGTDALLWGAVTWAICAVPAILSLFVTLWAEDRSWPEQLLSVVLVLGLRYGLVISAAVVVFQTVPAFRDPPSQELRTPQTKAYWGTLLVSYAVALGWEALLRAWRKRARNA